jgi:hypothetical protein
MGKNSNILVQLLGFNVGLELGQLLIVAIILLISFIFVGLLKVNRREYLLFISASIFALALKMAIERYPH